MSVDRLQFLPRIRIVLCQTSHPGNIGSAARAMKTMGINQLVLVRPKTFPSPEAHALSAGAYDILDNARVVETLEEGLAGCRWALSLSARRRELSLPCLDTRTAAEQLLNEAEHGDVALVFGTEMFGLSNEEVLRTNGLVQIAANPDYSSLNLAQAVQVLCYELRMHAGAALAEKSVETTLERASVDDIERFYVHLQQTLERIGFLNPLRPRRLMPRLRRLFGRAGLEKMEVDILRGVLTAVNERCEPADKARN